MASLPYPEARETLLASPKKMRALIHQAMGSDRFQGKLVVSTLPASDTQILQVTYHVQDGQADDAALLKDAKSAFKRIKLPSASKLDKRVRSDVPGGIVIDSGPFDRLIASLLEPDAARLAAREDVLLRFVEAPGREQEPREEEPRCAGARLSLDERLRQLQGLRRVPPLEEARQLEPHEE